MIATTIAKKTSSPINNLSFGGLRCAPTDFSTDDRRSVIVEPERPQHVKRNAPSLSLSRLEHLCLVPSTHAIRRAARPRCRRLLSQLFPHSSLSREWNEGEPRETLTG